MCVPNQGILVSERAASNLVNLKMTGVWFVFLGQEGLAKLVPLQDLASCLGPQKVYHKMKFGGWQMLHLLLLNTSPCFQAVLISCRFLLCSGCVSAIYTDVIMHCYDAWESIGCLGVVLEWGEGMF